MPDDRPGASPPSGALDRGGGTTALLVLCWVAWPLVPAGLVLAAIGTVLTFLGDLPTESERADSRRLLIMAAVVAVAIPLVGLAVAVRGRRRGSATAFGLAAVIALVLTGLLALATAEPEPRSAIPDHDPTGACREHSGGDTRCPGG